MSVEKYGWAVQKNLFVSTNQDYPFSYTHEKWNVKHNFKIF